jgi:hypothetical protein
MLKAKNSATARKIMKLVTEIAAETQKAHAANDETRSLVVKLIADQASKPRAPTAPTVRPHWGERALTRNERNSIEALVWYKAEELGIKPRTVEAAAEQFFGVEELSQLKAWDYDGLIRFLVDYEAANALSGGSDQASLSRIGESPAAC